ncbi:hypothetical protein HDE_12515 [Halotydeus destructor]|nr:hypothetical protein HDE_12515 [Halotydeus destructor]
MESLHEQDKSLNLLEDYLVRYALISGPISDVKQGIRNKRRRWHAIWRMFMDFFFTIRYIFLIALFYWESPHFMTWAYITGDYFHVYEKVVMVFYANGTLYSLICGLFRLTMFQLETRGQLHLVLWYDGIMSGNAQEHGLSEVNLVKMKKTIRQSVAIFKCCEKAWLLGLVVHIVLFTMTIMKRPPIYMMVWFFLWLVLLIHWLTQTWGVKSILPLACYLSYVYFKLKYRQVREALDHFVHHGQENGGRPVDLRGILSEHNALAGQVANHNMGVQWVLGTYNYICGPLVASSLLAGLTVEFRCPLHQGGHGHGQYRGRQCDRTFRPGGRRRPQRGE